jgi:Flp pilus assembly pilin Flp
MNAAKLLSNRGGQGLTEYMILVFLVALVSLGTIKAIGSSVMNRLEQVQDTIQREVNLNHVRSR